MTEKLWQELLVAPSSRKDAYDHDSRSSCDKETELYTANYFFVKCEIQLMETQHKPVRGWFLNTSILTHMASSTSYIPTQGTEVCKA